MPAPVRQPFPRPLQAHGRRLRGGRPRAARPTRVRLAPTALVLGFLPAACGDGSVAPEVTSLQIVPEAGLVVGSGRESFNVIARGPDGVLDPAGVRWSVGDPAIAAVAGDGDVTGVNVGTTTVTAELGGVTATASVEVYQPPSVASYEPGVSYFGRRDYIEYIPGELPVVLSSGHGGSLTPSEMANRGYGIVVQDRNTLELTLAVRDALVDLTGHTPYVVISHLARRKLDPNREIGEAAQDDPFAERAWTEYHQYIERARAEVRIRGEGMYFDIHGHGHPIERIELGYLLGPERLNLADFYLDQLSVVQLTSIREIGRDSPIPFSQVLRGPTSFGGLLEAEGIPAIPSPEYPMIGEDPYFSGGYSTLRHGSNGDAELVSGIQLEHHFDGIRDSDASRRAYAAILARVIRDFMLEHIGYFEP